MQATLISRMSKLLKAEAITATSKIEIDGYTISSNGRTITCDEDGDGYEIWYYRCGEEVIAVPTFYIDEDGVSLTGSRGGEYELNGETLTKE